MPWRRAVHRGTPLTCLRSDGDIVAANMRAVSTSTGTASKVSRHSLNEHMRQGVKTRWESPKIFAMVATLEYKLLRTTNITRGPLVVGPRPVFDASPDRQTCGFSAPHFEPPTFWVEFVAGTATKSLKKEDDASTTAELNTA